MFGQRQTKTKCYHQKGSMTKVARNFEPLFAITTWKKKISDFWFFLTTGIMIYITSFLCLLISACEWLKSLFIKEKPVVTDEKPVQFHCHQCGEKYPANREIIRFRCRPLMVSGPRECPHCGSLKTMPVMFEEENLYEEEYRGLWRWSKTHK